MNINKKQLSIILLTLYVLGLIFSSFALFNLKDELIYDLNVLAISDIDKAEPVFLKTYLIVGLSMVFGLLAIYFSFKTDEANVIYVEKTKEELQKEADKADSEARKDDKLNREEFVKLNSKELSTSNLNKILSHICNRLQASQGAVYLKEEKDNKRKVLLKASYAMSVAESEVISFEFGEGLVGQAAKEKKTLYIQDIPEGFVKVVSGLGEAKPSYLLIVPMLKENELLGVVEISSFTAFRKNDIETLEKFFSGVGEKTERVKIDKSDKKPMKELVDVAQENTEAVKKSKKKKSEDK